MNTKHTIESLLHISAHALTAKKLADILGIAEDEAKNAADELVEDYKQREGGIQVDRIGKSYQMSTTASTSPIIQQYLEEEEKKELTKPSLETLTIIAYRGPITKAELELIRGVNCSLILRNLLIRGLIEEVESSESLSTTYNITFDFLHYLGIRENQELPDFEKLNANENLAEVLKSDTEDEQEEKKEPLEQEAVQESENDDEDDDENDEEDEDDEESNT